MSVLSVYAIFASEDEARRIGRQMVEEKLAACVNVLGSVTSFYRWNDKVEEKDEVAAIFKTSTDQADRLIVRIAALHSYDVPCITTSPIDKVLGDYADWIEGNVEA